MSELSKRKMPGIDKVTPEQLAKAVKEYITRGQTLRRHIQALEPEQWQEFDRLVKS